VTSDDNSPLMLTLPAELLRQKLETLLDGGQVGSVSLQPVFDTTHGAGATIRHMLNFLFTELEQPDSILTNAIARAAMAEGFELRMLANELAVLVVATTMLQYSRD